MRVILVAAALLVGCSSPTSFGPTANATRGKYLAQAVLFCGDCHTTPQANGLPSFDPSDFLAGGRAFEVQMGAGKQTFYAPNLTSDNETGLGNWTDDQIKRAITHGIDNQGHALFPIMPYFAFANLTDDDLEALVRMLRLLPAKSNMVMQDTFTISTPANPIRPDQIPDTSLPSSDANYASAERGRYLAGSSCIVCHTPQQVDLADPLDLSRAFAGGQAFAVGPLTTLSANLTSDATGLLGWTADQLIATLQLDQERGVGRPLCPPMPAGPNRAGDMTPGDLADVANYITTLKAQKHGPFGCTDGGVPYGFDAL